MVGTPEYQVAACSRATGQKLLALKRLGTMVVPPLAKVEKRTPNETVDVEEGHYHQGPVLFREAVGAHDVVKGRCEVGVAEGDALGSAGSPAGVEEEGYVVGGGAFGLALAHQCCAFPCQADCPVTRVLGLDTEESELLGRSPRGVLLREGG